MDEDRKGNVAASRAETTNTIVSLAVAGLFAYWSLTVIAPFALLIIWAVIVAVAVYPAYAALRRLFSGRGGLSATFITVIGLVIVLGPLAAISVNFVDAADSFVTTLKEGSLVVPGPPETVREWPLIGARVHEAWTLAATNLDAALSQISPSLLEAGGAVLARIAGIAPACLGLRSRS